jgi:hypothetical protein
MAKKHAEQLPPDYPPEVHEATPSGFQQTQYAINVAHDLAQAIGSERPTFAMLDNIKAQITAYEQALPNLFPIKRFGAEVFEFLQQELQPDQAQVVLRWVLTRQAQASGTNRPK